MSSLFTDGLSGGDPFEDQIGSRTVHAVSNFRNDESAELKSVQQPSRRITGKTDPKISKWMNKIKYFDDEDEFEQNKKRKRGGSKKSSAGRLMEEEDDDDKEHTDDEDKDLSSLVILPLSDEEESGEEYSLKGSRSRKPARGKSSQSPRSSRSPADCKKARLEKRLATKNRQIKTKFESDLRALHKLEEEIEKETELADGAVSVAPPTSPPAGKPHTRFLEREVGKTLTALSATQSLSACTFPPASLSDPCASNLASEAGTESTTSSVVITSPPECPSPAPNATRSGRPNRSRASKGSTSRPSAPSKRGKAKKSDQSLLVSSGVEVTPLIISPATRQVCVLRLRAGTTHTFEIPIREPLGGVMAQLCAIEAAETRVEADSLVCTLLWESAILRADDTLESCGYMGSALGSIECTFYTRPSPTSSQLDAARLDDSFEAADLTGSVELKIRADGHQASKVRAKKTEKLSDVLKRAFWVGAGTHRLGQQLRAALETGRANLHFDGRRVGLGLTPAELQLEDGDILDLYL